MTPQSRSALGARSGRKGAGLRRESLAPPGVFHDGAQDVYDRSGEYDPEEPTLGGLKISTQEDMPKEKHSTNE